MKLTKISVYRLILEKTCGCKAEREYSDPQYKTPIADGEFTSCDKHKGNKLLAEFAGEMMLESLDKEAESAGKTFVAPNPYRPVVEGDSGGVMAVGAESVQTMGAIPQGAIPQARAPQHGPRRNPLEITKVAMDRPVGSHTTRVAGPSVASLTTAAPEIVKGEDGIEFNAEIGVEVEENPRVTEFIAGALGGLEDDLDAQDSRLAGIPQSMINRGE
jgi:hypothetical protein